MQNQARSAFLNSLILQTIEASMSPLSAEDILALDAKLSPSELKPLLFELMESGKVVETRHGDFSTPERLGLVTGTVIGHRDGFGFVSTQPGPDLFLPPKEMAKVFHNDFVLAVPSNIDKRGRREGKILRVLKARKLELVGRFFKEGQMRFVVPDDSRINQDIVIGKNHTMDARQGQVVVVEVIERPVLNRNAVGKVIEILGDKMEPGMEVQVALRNHDIPHEWPSAVNKAMESLSEEVDEKAKQGRVDLRALPLITIDGEDARDFDDAVYCEKKRGGGWRLWVAIADVSYYVRPDTPLDNEAINRGNSVYFPDQVVPMLPEKLSNGLCSLNPEVDRLCMVAEMTISAAGRLSGYKFYEAVMHSHARLTYNKVAAMLDGDEALSARYSQQQSLLRELHNLYLALKGARAVRGGIELETEETRFIFNAQRKIEQIVPLVRNDAHKIIEECMIQANVAAARFVEKAALPILFRVHDRPSDEKLGNFRQFLGELGLSLGGEETPEPKDYFVLAESITERADRELIQTMLLRSMMQAVYQVDNIGHFGLALSSYAHFTSPIRRYPDLLLHRVIKYLLAKEQAEQAGKTLSRGWTPTGGRVYQESEMDDFGAHCSMTERRADDATREVADGLKCEFMLDHVGMIMPGSIAAVTAFGFFVRLDELHIDGLVHISSLRGDYYHYDAARQLLIGENTRRRFRIGDRLSVKVAAVNMNDRKLEFELVNSEGRVDEFERPAARPHGDKKKSKKDKQRHRDSKNIGKRRKSSGEQKASALNPWEKSEKASREKPQSDKPHGDKPKADKFKGEKGEKSSKKAAKVKKKRKQRAGKKERAAKKQGKANK